MSKRETLKKLVDNPKKPNISEWVYEIEDFLNETQNQSTEAQKLIDTIKRHGDFPHAADNLVALLRQTYKKKYDQIEIPAITKRNQIFVAMMFSQETDPIYEEVYAPVIQMLNYTSMRIDKKEYTGSIIGEITAEISDSVALIADLTGNRGGVYYEAGIARGLQLCNHPIKLVLTCKKSFFEREKVHFDVSGDNILLYTDENDLKTKLKARLISILLKEA
jgi:hypothetical protein